MTANRPVSVTAASLEGADRARAGAERFAVRLLWLGRAGYPARPAARVLMLAMRKSGRRL